MSSSDHNHNYYDSSGNYYDFSGNYHAANHTDSDEHESHTDSSNNITTFYDASGSSTYITNIRDISGTTSPVLTICEDDSIVSIPVPIVSDLSTVTITGDGYKVVNQTGIAADGSSVIRTTFTSTDPSNNAPNINENLSEIVTTYNDETANSQSSILLQQIQSYASEIKCSDFHGKGSIDDYTALFRAASSIANESKQMDLDIDIEGFSEFGQAADDLSNLFESFITKLQNVNIINDITFLTTISIALGKIVNLSKIFGRFKETIISTTTIEVPKSLTDTKVILEGVMGEVNCAMQYINYFVSPTDSLPEAKLTSTEQNIITQAIHTIDTWNNLCEQGVSIAMANDTDIQYIKHASSELKTTTQNLKSVTSRLKDKFVSINITC
jgi:hypothetical protein